jgi:YHS domain-containing protein
LLWLVVLFWTVVLLRRAAAWLVRSFLNSLTRGTASTTDQRPAISSHRLVRDPVCGVHVAEDRAIPLQVAGELVYFCSAACRDKYAVNEQKFAANG